MISFHLDRYKFQSSFVMRLRISFKTIIIIKNNKHNGHLLWLNHMNIYNWHN